MKILKINLIGFVLLFSFCASSRAQTSDTTKNKIAFVTVSGEGKTKQAALSNALRNAIEQAFGTFISSNTQILNDELVKDEIVSVSNGNIQEYKIISEIQTTDSSWSNTVQAKVSIDKLTTFCESKGIKVEFKGGIFAMNIKQQVLNEQNEIKAVDNMCKVLKEISDRSFDFEIKAGEPTALDAVWKIPLSVNVKINKNFQSISDYFGNTLKGISLTKTEAENYIKIKKPVYSIAFIPISIKTETAYVFYLRKDTSLFCILDFLLYFKHSLTNFTISNGIENIVGSNLIGKRDLNDNFRPIICKSPPSLFSISSGADNFDGFRISLKQIPVYLLFPLENLPSVVTANTRIYGRNGYASDPFDFYLVISFATFGNNYNAVTFSFNDVRTTDELSKITEYKISPILK